MSAETISALRDLVISVGFPIVAWACQFWQANTTLKAVTDSMNLVNTTLTKLNESMDDIQRRT